MTSGGLNRNHRVADVMISLGAAHIYGQKLGSLQLQKFIYLCDVLSALWLVVSHSEGQETYKHGPYDKYIQNAADLLSFRGFLHVDYGLIDSSHSRLEYSRYSINQFGGEVYKRIEESNQFDGKIEISKLVAREVEVRGWGKLKSLVYNEPSFAQIQPQGWYLRFNHNSLFSNISLAILRDFEYMLTYNRPNVIISKSNLVSIFFKLLD